MEAEGEVANIILAGVGGQGSVLASRLLATAAMHDGREVKLAETFGAATRGGSVLTHVRIGEAGHLWAPTMMDDEADVVVALEPLEALRAAVRFLKPGGWALFNTHRRCPVDVALGRASYTPLERIAEGLRRLGGRVAAVDATRMAAQAGDARAANTVMLGGLSALGVTGISEASLRDAMESRWSGQLASVNRRAYDLGYSAVRECMGELE
jgi:indolepyruvate ferredoxin oxidoreductase beta subunit